MISGLEEKGHQRCSRVGVPRALLERFWSGGLMVIAGKVEVKLL